MSDPVILVCGDLVAFTDAPYNAGNLANAQTNVALMLATPSDLIVAPGDISNDSGTALQYDTVAATLAPIKAKMRPAIGNHDYFDYANSGFVRVPTYFSYFGAVAGASLKGWYSFDLPNNWHVIGLNSNYWVDVGVSGVSEQGQWLAADLAANPGKHIIAFWHHPVVTSTVFGDETFWKTPGSFWHQLHQARAEIILNGHSHLYERYARQDWQGKPDPSGIRQFVVGTGMSNMVGAGTPPQLEVNNNGNYAIGFLRLTLGASSYSWQYMPAIGTFTDTGTTNLLAQTPAPSPGGALGPPGGSAKAV